MFDNQEYYADGEVAKWRDVLYYFWQQTKSNVISVFTHLSLFAILSYTFVLGTSLFGASTQILGGCDGANLFLLSTNPVSMLIGGAMITCLFQSSTISNLLIGILVTLSAIEVQDAVYFSMGANIGNSITSTIISLAHLSNKNLLERAVAGSSVNTIYYVFTLCLLFPLELGCGALRRLGEAVAPETVNFSYPWAGLNQLIIVPVTNFLIVPNTVYSASIMAGAVDNCQANYPTACVNDEVSFQSCTTGFIGCDPESGRCPVFFHEGASMAKDMQWAALAMFIALVTILLSLWGIIGLINKMLQNTPIEVIAKMTTHNNYVLMFLGCGASVLFNNSSIVETSILPFVSSGILELEQMFPWCLGSNFGVALANFFFALSLGNQAYVAVAITNLAFNGIGTLIWYPIPYLREFPIHSALVVGIITRMWRYVCVVYFGLAFIVFPLLLFGIGHLLYGTKKSSIGFGWTLVGVILLVLLHFSYGWFFKGGRESFIEFFEEPSDDVSVDENTYDDYDTEDYDDYDTEDDVSSIGFQEARVQKSKSKRNSNRGLNKVRPQAAAPPPERKRLIKSAGLDKDNCCCADPTFLGA